MSTYPSSPAGAKPLGWYLRQLNLWLRDDQAVPQIITDRQQKLLSLFTFSVLLIEIPLGFFVLPLSISITQPFQTAMFWIAVGACVSLFSAHLLSRFERYIPAALVFISTFIWAPTAVVVIYGHDRIHLNPIIGISSFTVVLAHIFFQKRMYVIWMTLFTALCFAIFPFLMTSPDPVMMITPLINLSVLTLLIFLFDDYRTRLEKERRAELTSANESLTQEITQRKQIEIQREQLIRDLQIAHGIAQENSRLKSEFLATMSHELRTPLNAIEGFTSIMLGNMGIDLNPQAQKFVDRIGVNSRRLLDLINDFLDLSRIESGRLELVSTPIRLTELVEVWSHQVSVLAEKKNIEFVATIDPALPPVVAGDEEALSKVCLNLLGNAVKFTREGTVSLALKHQDGCWIIEVSDTGIGIPPHAREYIFDEFRQVDSSSKRLYGGAGLGLAIVQKLTRAMGGTVSVASEVGKGSTFTVVLPLLIPQPVN